MHADAARSRIGQLVYTGVIQDITALKLTFEKMEEQENLWKLAIDSLPLMFYVKDIGNSYRNVLCNRALTEFVKRPREEIIGKTEEEYYPLQLARQFREQDETILKTGQGMEIDESFADADGNIHYLHSIKTPFIQPNGRRLIIGITSDMTEINALLKGQQVMNSCLEMLITEKDMDKAIVKALHIICDHIGAVRSFIFQFNLEKRTSSIFAEYYKPGRPSVWGVVRDRPFSTKPNWAEIFKTQENILVEDIQRDGAKKGLDKSWIETILKYSATSISANRIMLNGKLWGYIGLVYEERKHVPTPVEVKFIVSVAHFVETMLMRRENQERLLAALEQAKVQTAPRAFSLRPSATKSVRR